MEAAPPKAKVRWSPRGSGAPMGMMFPLGMRVAQRIPGAPTAWFWALNGTASTLASIIAILISIHVGILATLLVGVAIYALGLAALARYARAN